MFLFFQCFERQRRRGNIALITTLPVPDCLCSGCATSAAQKSGEKDLYLLGKNIHNKKTFNDLKCFILLVPVPHLYMSPITSLSLLLQPILDGRKRQNRFNSGQPKLTAMAKQSALPHIAMLKQTR